MIREFDGGEHFAADCFIRHTVFTCRVSPRGAPEIRACRAQFKSVAAPETGEFEPHREDFGVLSLFRILMVPRETWAQVHSVHSRQIKAKLINHRRVKICGLAYQPAAGGLEAEHCSLLAPVNGNIDAAAERFASKICRLTPLRDRLDN